MSNHKNSTHGQTLKHNSQQDGTNVQHDDAEKKSQKTKDKSNSKAETKAN